MDDDKRERETQDSSVDSAMLFGAGAGVALGAGVGTALGNIALGAGIGTALGAAAGVAWAMMRAGKKRR